MYVCIELLCFFPSSIPQPLHKKQSRMRMVIAQGHSVTVSASYMKRGGVGNAGALVGG